jgi:hypothetical protein
MSTSNFSIKVLLIPIVILLFSMQIGICAANTIYVDQSGSGDYITIEAGINAAYVGDVVKVLPGIYYESVRVNKKITLLGSGPHYTTINASKTTSDAVYMYSYGATISGFTITGNKNGISILQGIIKNCVITGCSQNGVIIYDSYFNVTLLNATIVLNDVNGIWAYLTGTDTGNTAYLTVYSSIISFNKSDGINQSVYDTGSPGSDGIRSYISRSFNYNNIFGNSSNSYGDISQNPNFIDQSAGNFALRHDSPCRDSGKPGPTFNDPDGTRNDMGAYGGPDTAAYWPYSEGPTITDIYVSPASVPKGGKITIKAKARVR